VQRCRIFESFLYFFYSLIKKAKEPIIVVDKRTGEKIAKITPLKEEDDLELLNKLNYF